MPHGSLHGSSRTDPEMQKHGDPLQHRPSGSFRLLVSGSVSRVTPFVVSDSPREGRPAEMYGCVSHNYWQGKFGMGSPSFGSLQDHPAISSQCRCLQKGWRRTSCRCESAGATAGPADSCLLHVFCMDWVNEDGTFPRRIEPQLPCCWRCATPD